MSLPGVAESQSRGELTASLDGCSGPTFITAATAKEAWYRFTGLDGTRSRSKSKVAGTSANTGTNEEIAWRKPFSFSKTKGRVDRAQERKPHVYPFGGFEDGIAACIAQNTDIALGKPLDR
uniref:Uncharacterized protein n=1 Tax=Myotis myotis TaxID=51298 RepID=A0A7J7XI29_MYOMY|nr:hypothetical protein mMyoMyo1_011822 [Myotis myotis]